MADLVVVGKVVDHGDACQGQEQEEDGGDGQEDGPIGGNNCIECGSVVSHGTNEVGDGDQQDEIVLVHVIRPVHVIVQLGQDPGCHLLPVRNCGHPRGMRETEEKEDGRGYQEGHHRRDQQQDPEQVRFCKVHFREILLFENYLEVCV